MVTLADALQHLSIDYADELVRSNVQRALNSATSVLKGAVGDDIDDYLPDDPRRDELVLMYTEDLYSERGAKAKVSGATRKLAADMELQLRLELRRAREADANGV